MKGTLDSASEGSKEIENKEDKSTLLSEYKRNRTKYNNKIKEEIIDDNKPDIEELPNDKNKEQVNQKIEDSRKEIENKEDNRALLSENKHNRNKENIKHMEMKTKKMRQIHQRKLIKTREELEMMNNGLVNVLNILSTEHRKISNFKNNRRSLIEIVIMTHNKTVRKNLRKSIGKFNTPEIKMHNKISVIRLMMDIPLTYLFNKQNDKVIEVGHDTSENYVSERLQYMVIERDVTRTEIMMSTIVS